MQNRTKSLVALLLALPAAAPASTVPSRFQHIVIMVQENRTPDNLFYALCATKKCSTNPDNTEYDIQTANWLDKNASGGTIQPSPLSLVTGFGPQHSHAAFVAMCDFDTASGGCRMDGAGDIPCPGCLPNTQFTYVDNSHGAIDPYMFIAGHYGWANYMFQTNQGPSFPAHQFLFGATSAPSLADDHKGTFAAENAKNNIEGNMRVNGCIAPSGSTVELVNAKGHEKKAIYPCFEHRTLGDLLDTAEAGWRYYTPGAGNLWSAPDAIKHICRPHLGQCRGLLWRNHVAIDPVEVLLDINKCDLQAVSWVIPSAQYSDHAGTNTGGGPAWIPGVINAIGNSQCKNGDGTSYWNSTAILVTWDDWGGFYDHEPPTFLPYPEGGYQYGFRVPFLFVSAYTPKGYISNERQDFGDIIRFVEFNFGIAMGGLSFADARSTGNLAHFYDLSATPRPFVTIPAPGLGTIIAAKRTLEPPDDD